MFFKPSSIVKFLTKTFGWLAFGTCLCGGIISATAQERLTHTLPNFFDPRLAADKPDTENLTGLRFVMTDDFPPFSYRDGKELISGYHVDMARKICEILEQACTLKLVVWDDIPAMLIQKRADISLAGLKRSSELRDTLDFSHVYMRIPGRFVARRDKVDSLYPETGFAATRIGTVGNSAHAAFIKNHLPDSLAVEFAKPRLMREALVEGKIDAIFGSALNLSFWLNDEPGIECCQFVGGPYLESRYFGHGLSAAISKDRQDILQAVNYALLRMHQTGALTELYLRYFPIGLF